MRSVAILAVGGLAGACLGSFAVTAGLRAARSEQALTGRSHCDRCQTPLGFAQTLPLIGYLRARGACRTCAGAIDPAHLAGELAGAVIVPAALCIASPWRAGLVALIGLTLLGQSALDIRALRLADAATAGLTLMALALAALSGWIGLVAGLAAGLVTFATLEGLRRGYLALRRQPGLGQGDVKLAAALAVWLGLATPWAVVGAAVLGLIGAVVLRPGSARFAFGPYLAASAWLTGLGLELWTRPGDLLR